MSSTFSIAPLGIGAIVALSWVIRLVFHQWPAEFEAEQRQNQDEVE